jgi:hypothetical protein
MDQSKPSAAFFWFLTLAWLASWVAPAVEAWHTPRAFSDGPLLLLIALSCRIPPFHGLTLRGLLRFWFWFTLTGLLFCLGLAVLVCNNPKPLALQGLIPLAALFLLLLIAGLLLLYVLARPRIKALPTWSPPSAGLPLWRPLGRSLTFLGLGIVLLNGHWLHMPYPPTAARAGAALALLLLALILLWRELVQPALQRRWPTAGAWSGQAAVLGICGSWVLDLAWLVHQGRLPAEVLSAPILWPGLLTLLLGAEFLVLGMSWRSRSVLKMPPATSHNLPLQIACVLLLWALWLQRPGLALGLACFAAWLELRPRPAPLS